MDDEHLAGVSPAPPDNVLPGATETSLLVRLDDVTAVAVTGVVACPQGFLFELCLYQRGRSHRRGIVVEPAVLRVRYADGRGGELRVPDGLRPRTFGGAATHSELLVVPWGSSPGPGPARQQIWVSPLAPEGPVELALASVDGRPMGRFELAGAELLQAAARAVEVWPAGRSVPPFEARLAPALPPEGVAPANRGEAATEIRYAFEEVFTAGRDGFGYVQDGEVLRAPAQVAGQRWPEVAESLRVGLGELVFLDAVRAAVQYQLSWSGPAEQGPQIGYAIRELGRWKVARGTYTSLLDAAGVPHPPPPPVA